jgi:tetratricopeptide (TPR) repeat protein
MKSTIFFTRSVTALLVSLFSIQNMATEVVNDGISAFNEGRYQSAEAFFLSKLKETAYANESLFYLSKIDLQKGDTETAVKHIDQALLIEPNNAEELLASGDAYCSHAQKSSIFTALKFAKKCIAQYDSAVNMEPENATALLAAIKFHMEAPSIAGGSAKRGNELMDRLVRLSPEDANVYKIYLLDKDGKEKNALALADELSQKGLKAAENQYAIAHYYKDKKLFAQSKALLEPLLTWKETPKNRWHINDSYLQLGEIFLAEGKDNNQGIRLIEEYKKKNNNPNDIHYFWSTWSLAKGYKALGQSAKYDELVKSIKSMDYKKDTAFAKEFDKNI